MEKGHTKSYIRFRPLAVEKCLQNDRKCEFSYLKETDRDLYLQN